MIITYQGDNYFKLQAGPFIVLIDPTNQRSFKGANLIVNTVKSIVAPPSDDAGVIWVEHQGEYEIKGIELRGWSINRGTDKEKTVYRLIMDDLTIGVLGYADRLPSEDVKEYLTGVDIILGPAVKDGGWIKQLEPAIVIPALKGKELESLAEELGVKRGEEVDKLTVKRKEITPGKLRLICLKS